MKAGLLLFGLLLAGCSQQSAPPPVPAPTPPAADPAPVAPIVEPAQVATLAGEWRIAGIDGKSLDEPVGIALRGSDQELWWEPRCAGMVRSYRINGTRFSTGPRLDMPARKPGDPTPPVCAIGLPRGLDAAMRAIDGADTIRRTPSNGIELSGGGHSLILFSQ